MTGNDKCSEVMDKFLELDKNQHIPLDIATHFLSCTECRKNAKMISQAEKYLSQEGTGQNPFAYSAISDVKEKIFPGSTKERKIPIYQWMIIGLILVICMIFASVSVNKYFPQIQSINFIFVAGAITTYFMLFIGLNMDFLSHE